MIIRPAAIASDLPSLRALWRATWREAYGGVPGPDRLRLVDEALAEPRVLGMVPADGGCRVAVVGLAIVGSACFAERHGRGYVWGLYVLPGHRRRCVGRALLGRAARDMPGAWTLDLGTATPAAEAFHRHLGFVDAAGPDVELFVGVTRRAWKNSIWGRVPRRASDRSFRRSSAGRSRR